MDVEAIAHDAINLMLRNSLIPSDNWLKIQDIISAAIRTATASVEAERDDLARTHTQKMAEYLVKVGELRAERDAARAEVHRLHDTAGCFTLYQRLKALFAPSMGGTVTIPLEDAGSILNDLQTCVTGLAEATKENAALIDASSKAADELARLGEYHTCGAWLWSSLDRERPEFQEAEWRREEAARISTELWAIVGPMIPTEEDE